MHYMGWLLNATFLGLKGGFWFVGLPFATLLIYIEYYNWKNEREEEEDLAIENVIVNLSKEEKWMLDNLIKKSNSRNLDEYVAKVIKSIKQPSSKQKI